MDLRKLKTLIDLVSESNVSELEITEADGKVRIVKAGAAPVVMMQAAPQAAQAVAAAPAAVEAVGGVLSDKFGAHQVTWWVLWVSWVCLFLLSYPQTDLTVLTVDGPRTFHVGLNVYVFTAPTPSHASPAATNVMRARLNAPGAANAPAATKSTGSTGSR